MIAKEPPALYAHRLFLTEVVDSLRAMARDRARCEAWSLLLAQCADLVTPPFRTNPYNGLDYQETRDGGVITIHLKDPNSVDPACRRF